MTLQVFDKVLVANRGEIAIRIMKTLRKMGIKSVAVYSDADASALHIRYADEAYYIGDSSAKDSYLSIENIIAAIRATGAQAVHPGYGFLSENSEFALALEREHVTLIGPSSYAIKVMGDKVEAKIIAKDADVTIVPGYMGIIDSSDEAIDIANEIGWPVIVKAAAGGGGRGMRVVHDKHGMSQALASARMEAQSCFRDGRVFIEKLIESPRHIEIQILCDQYGNSVCLGERECSIQRHHQKVIEETPSPFVDENMRQRMYAESIRLAQKVGYYSAGTVEFIVDKHRNFYFLEMNTRLQVEHCVTELVTGIDIVEQMILIAAKKPLSFVQDDIKMHGAAMECRIYAEDPLRGFLPSSGRVIEYIEPPKSPHIRIDSGIHAGYDITMFYDPMIAKLCTYRSTRAEVIEEMRAALGAFIIKGINHNISFLEAIVANKKFIDGDITTGFISDEYPDGFLGAELTSEIMENFLATAVYVFMSEQKRLFELSGSSKLGSRWVVTLDNKHFQVIVKHVDDGLNIRHENTRIYIRTQWNVGEKLFRAYVNGRSIHVKVERVGSRYTLTHAGIILISAVRSIRVAELESLMVKKDVNADLTEEVASLTGQLIGVRVKDGDVVNVGDELFILTAMKMENVIKARRNGIIDKVMINEHDHVVGGQVLLVYR